MQLPAPRSTSSASAALNVTSVELQLPDGVVVRGADVQKLAALVRENRSRNCGARRSTPPTPRLDCLSTYCMAADFASVSPSNCVFRTFSGRSANWSYAREGRKGPPSSNPIVLFGATSSSSGVCEKGLGTRSRQASRCRCHAAECLGTEIPHGSSIMVLVLVVSCTGPLPAPSHRRDGPIPSFD